MYNWLTYYVKWHFARPVKPEDFCLNLRGCLYIPKNEYDVFKITCSSTCKSEGVEYCYHKMITKNKYDVTRLDFIKGQYIHLKISMGSVLNIHDSYELKKPWNHI